MFGIEAVDVVGLCGQALCGEPVRHGNARRMVGHRQVLIAQHARLCCHGFKAGGAIAGGCVDMKIPLDVGLLNKGWQSARLRGCDLPVVFAQFGADPGQPDGAVDRCLRLAGNALLSSEDAVLVDLQTLGLRKLAQCDVMRLRAGEIHQRRAESIGPHHPQVHLHAIFQDDAGAGGAC